MQELPIIARAMDFASSIAIVEQSSASASACANELPSNSGIAKQTTYRQLLERSEQVARWLLGRNSQTDLQEVRVAMLVPPSADYAAVQWGIWRAGGIMLPLCLSATEPEWEYAIIDSQVGLLVTTAMLADRLRSLCTRVGVELMILEEVSDQPEIQLPQVHINRRAMILYTSGTTNRPKGVVTTHANIQSQIVSLIEAWQWQSTDRIPLFLPLHHIHGIINVLSCGLWSGAKIEVFDRFDMQAVFDRVRVDAYTLFMAVPTIYVKMIEGLRSANAEDRAAITAGFQSMRLMVSGSAALLASVHQEWFRLTGQPLLERYGMTEIGMAISNPYVGERRPGAVGQPLPGVDVRLQGALGDDQPGEIQVRGPGVFLEYWNRPAATIESFEDGWFKTGDMAILERGYYRIMGRISVDIIKSGGYKLSALEIEDTLLAHPAIDQCAVIGVTDATWGEAVAAAIVLKTEQQLTLDELRTWCRDRLSVYKIPKKIAILDSLPRNAMGKVTKPSLREVFCEPLGS